MVQNLFVKFYVCVSSDQLCHLFSRILLPGQSVFFTLFHLTLVKVIKIFNLTIAKAAVSAPDTNKKLWSALLILILQSV